MKCMFTNTLLGKKGEKPQKAYIEMAKREWQFWWELASDDTVSLIYMVYLINILCSNHVRAFQKLLTENSFHKMIPATWYNIQPNGEHMDVIHAPI